MDERNPLEGNQWTPESRVECECGNMLKPEYRDSWSRKDNITLAVMEFHCDWCDNTYRDFMIL